MDITRVSTVDVSDVAGLKQAFADIGAARAAGVLQPYTVRLHGGIYELDEPLRIGADTPRVTVEPFGREEVMLSGGRRITGFAPDSFNGVACLSAVLPEGTAPFTDLYIGSADGLCPLRAADRVRWPKGDATFPILDCEHPGGNLNEGSNWIAIDPEQLRGAGLAECDLGRATVSFCHLWVDEHSPVAAFDCESGRIDLACRSGYRVVPGRPDRGETEEIWFENLPSRFGAPGEFYADFAAGKLYYIPRGENETAGTVAAYIPSLTTVVEMKGDALKGEYAENIRLRSLNIAVSRGDAGGAFGHEYDFKPEIGSPGQSVSSSHAAVEFTSARFCSVEDCNITCVGLYGVRIESCDGVRVENTAVEQCGGGGVIINGANIKGDDRLATRSVVVRGCRLAHLGRRYYAGCGVLLMNAMGCEIAENEIFDLRYSGISGGWVWGYSESRTRDCRITDNHIYDCGQKLLSDMGGVYLLGAQPGTIVARNVIHDVTCRGYGAWCLYTDEGSGMVILEDNVCYDAGENAFHQHYGRANAIRGNIFAFSGLNSIRVSRAEEHISDFFENNIILTDGEGVARFPGKLIEDGNAVLRSNLLWDVRGGELRYGDFVKGGPIENTKTFDELRARGMEEGSIVADPLFADARGRDFTLSDDSPAYALGFPGRTNDL